VDEVGELDRVADEEDAQVVADQIPVAVLGVELHREPARIARHFRRVAAADDGREADRERRFLPGLLEQPGPRILRGRFVADLPRRLELAVADEPARVHDALGNAFAVEMRDLFQEMIVLERRRSAAADSALRLIVDDGVSLSRGEAAIAFGWLFVLLRHRRTPG
jgi:hypothetical protein